MLCYNTDGALGIARQERQRDGDDGDTATTSYVYASFVVVAL